jgi:hypothetical protein
MIIFVKNHINIDRPNGLVYCNMDEYFISKVNGFYSCANWYNCTSRNIVPVANGHDYTIIEAFKIELPALHRPGSRESGFEKHFQALPLTT